MNICQISSLDLLLCLQNGEAEDGYLETVPLNQSPFFQQVLTIAQEAHLVCVSDYAIASFLQAELSPESQLQLEKLLSTIEIWQTNPTLQAQAETLSQTDNMALADAIDHVIYEHLCPDWILVAEEGRSLPNATSLAEFWREWIDLRDDLPPDGGLSVGKYPTGGNGGGSPQDSGNSSSNKSSHASHLTAESNLLASNSVVFSHRNFVAWSMGLYNITNLPIGTLRPPSQAAEPHENPPVKLASSNLAASPNLPINVRVVIDPTTQQPTIVVLTDAEVAALNLARTSLPPTSLPTASGAMPPGAIAQNPIVQALAAQFGHSNAATPALAAQITQAVQAVIRGDVQNNVLVAQAGNDLLLGGGGADFLDGGTGVDTASYAIAPNPAAPSAVAVSLATDQATAGEATGEPLQNIENLDSIGFDDTLGGDQQANILAGRLGNDFGYNNTPIAMGPDMLPSSNVNAIDASTAATPTGLSPTNPAPTGIIDMSDWIFAAAGDDVIDAGDGNNFVDAGAGNNQIRSGEGQDLFVLNPGNGVTTILHFQQHDRLGLVGGVVYEDLSLTPMPDANSTPRLKISLTRNGIEDVLAIVIGVSSLEREAFRSVQYQLPDTSLTPTSSSSSSLPTTSTHPNSGMSPAIPDWLQITQPGQLGQVLSIPHLYQSFPA